MSIFRESYQREVEARYKEAVQERLHHLLDMNDAKLSIFTRGALGKVFGGDVRESIAQLQEEIIPAISPLHVQTIGALAAVHRDVRANARRQYSEDVVNKELGDVWDNLQREVQALTPDNLKEFMRPDADLAAQRAAQNASVYDEAGEVRGYMDDHGYFTRGPEQFGR